LKYRCVRPQSGSEGLGLVMVVADVRNDKKYPDKGDSSVGVHCDNG
jgi:hypothetical protein